MYMSERFLEYTLIGVANSLVTRKRGKEMKNQIVFMKSHKKCVKELDTDK